MRADLAATEPAKPEAPAEPAKIAEPATPATPSPEPAAPEPSAAAVVTAPPESPGLMRETPAAPPPKPYAAAEVRNAIRRREISERQAGKPPETFQTAFVAYLGELGLSPGKFAVAATLIGFLGYFVFFSAPVTDGEIDAGDVGRDGVHEVSKSLKMSVLCTMNGKVLSVEPDKTVKFKIGDRVFILEFQVKPPVIIGTEEAEVDIVPYLQLRSGEVYAQCFSFRAR